MSKSPLQIGITGGIGSGKSTVCGMFAVLGIPIYEADARAKWLMNNDATLVAQITDRFGPEAYVDGALNRAYLSQAVFTDPEQVAFLNGLVHPRVKEDGEQWVQRQQGVPYVLREAAIMLEPGYHEHLDAVINVAADAEVRLLRVLLRDPHRDAEQVRAIMDKQLGEQERKEKATYTINNTGDRLLIPQVLTLHEKLLKKAAG